MTTDMTGPCALGAHWLGSGQCAFCVWAPRAETVEVQIVAPRRAVLPLVRDSNGYYSGTSTDIGPNSRYFYRLDGTKERPDPASRFQPEGVHGPSELVEPEFPWGDEGWRGLALRDFVIYELHVGTYTREGTFDALIPHLGELKELGVTAIEIMPVAQFPGTRNWGYDGAYPFAAQNSYGGPQGLKRLVNACHQNGLACILDVVYNHLGPEGNYFSDFAPYFTDKYKTPWGAALNFDGPFSDDVRHYFITNARYWIVECHVDALRLDAVHAIIDRSPVTFLEDLAGAVHGLSTELNRLVYLMPESAANDARLVRSRELGGYGLDAVWSDDFHHALRALLTGEQSGYYEDYGGFDHLVSVYRDGFAYCGSYSRFRRRRHGSSTKDIPAERFVVFAQNHDQIGNRARGDRLTQSVGFEALKLAAATVVLSPYLPLIFMGEEYAESAPFTYFISHSDPQLIEAVRRGRREEFAAFHEQDAMADPQDEATFLAAKLRHESRLAGRHKILREFYRELLRLRKGIPALADLNKDAMNVIGYDEERILFVHRWSGADHAILIESFGAAEITVTVPVPPGRWLKTLDSTDPRWAGGGSAVPVQLESAGEASLALAPESAVVFTFEPETIVEEIAR